MEGLGVKLPTELHQNNLLGELLRLLGVLRWKVPNVSSETLAEQYSQLVISGAGKLSFMKTLFGFATFKYTTSVVFFKAVTACS